VPDLNVDPERDLRERREQSIREICHDLRNPIATIAALAAAAMIEMDASSSPNEGRAIVGRRLEQIQEEARRMTQLVRQLLEDSTAPRLLDASDVAAEVAASCRVTFPGTIQVIAQAGAMVLVDEIALRRALANLIENATRAAGPDGSVLVRVRRARQWIHCEISDSGPGFGNGPSGSQALGLTIVDRLARSHGGRLEILDGSLGGAMLRLSLPGLMAAHSSLGDAMA
jgi:signal transduction histidine kinase